MSASRILFRLLIIASLGSWLLGCDIGSGTLANPDLNSTVSGYTGPAAKTADIRSFELNFWTFLKEDNRCGQCHAVGQTPAFVDLTDVNLAFSQAVPYVDLLNPSASAIVAKVNGGHQCWLGAAAAGACAANVEQMIINWATDSNVTSARQIQLTAPAIRDPGDAKSFPATATTAGTNGASFANTVHPVLIGAAAGIATNNCQGCHQETATPLPIAPFFGNADVNSAYESAKSKMDIDTPSNSRFVVRLRQESHNCWSSSCGNDADVMQAAIKLFADGIQPTPVDTSLVTSKALKISDGIVAAGGSRHESSLIAIWEFKSGLGSPTAFDTSGIDPAVDLTLIGSVNWIGGYGLDFTGGRAQANTFDSDKLHNFIQSTGEYAVEAWIIPANVTQEDANIIGYSGSDTSRNFTLGQRLYNYDFYNRIDVIPAEPNGEPLHSSDDGNGNEILQASLQHVVVNFDPINGRSLYVNGNLINVPDPVIGPVTINNVWDDSFTFILGNETSGNRPWRGKLRMVAIHNRTLSQAQVTQNFDVGVGEKYFLLFYIGHRIGIPQSYILFEVSQFDSYSYLFSTPTFINLDPNWTPVAIDIEGLRIGINGKEAFAGQVFANINETINGSYDPQLGQLLSPLGAVISLEKGPADEFFLSFERIGIGAGAQTNAFIEAPVSVAGDPTDPAAAVSSDIGIRTFEEIHATIAKITGVDINNNEVRGVYDRYFQQLPTVEAIDAFLPSHQMAIAQLALTSCSELVEDRGSVPSATYFNGFNFAASALNAFDTPTKRDQIILPLLTAVMNIDTLDNSNNLTSQPDETDITDLLGSAIEQHLDDPIPASGDEYDSLISEMLATGVNTTARTAQVVKAVCAVAIGGAVMLVQ